MKLQCYQVDAFTNQVFGGNSAVVCPLTKWLEDALLQKIAFENAVAETAFIVPKNERFEIRWFTPDFEMDLCGHATLATAHVISKHLDYPNNLIEFESKSGLLTVEIADPLIHLNFPSRKPVLATAPECLSEAMSIQPLEILKARDYLFVYESEDQIKNLKINTNVFNRVNLDPGGVVVTAEGEHVDFVSRFFTPQSTILEDPVTGSAHCTLIPFWAEKLNKNSLSAMQLSSRVGHLKCELKADRVKISGEAVTYMIGEIRL